MALQKTSKNRQKILLIVLAVVFVFSVGFMYWVYWYEPVFVNDVSLQNQSANSSKSRISTEILNDIRVKSLELHGPGEVQVEFRGSNANPFQSF